MRGRPIGAQSKPRRPRRFSVALPYAEHLRARAGLRQFYAARAAAIWTCGQPREREAQLAALRAEESSALDALAEEWNSKREARQRAAFTEAVREVTEKPSRQPARRRPLVCRQWSPPFRR